MNSFEFLVILIAQIEQISQESKDPKIDNILNLERVYFLVTLVNYDVTASTCTHKMLENMSIVCCCNYILNKLESVVLVLGGGGGLSTGQENLCCQKFSYD